MRRLALIAAFLLSLFGANAARAAGIGFAEFRVPDGAGKPLVVGVWYPSDAAAGPPSRASLGERLALGGAIAGHGLPLIVMSHGNGGWYGEHHDTAAALARAGFVVAAVSHTGDTFDDQSRATAMPDRPEHIHRLIDYMLADWPDHGRLDANRVGMFGFSSGGFTTLVSIGGVPDFTKVAAHVRDHPGYYDAQLIKRSGVSPDRFNMLPPSVWIHDPRIKAAVVAAPALGYTFGREGLRDIHIPVQLWRAEDDHILPHPDYAEAVRIALPAPPEYHVVPNADHYDFLAPCDAALAKSVPTICVSRPGFDRAAFHEQFNREVARFFEKTLG
jgi:predicted dienelactone hydrolase